MQLDMAVRLAVRTACHQISGRIMDQNMENTGENLAYVSRHKGARNAGEGAANHEQWQGKVYYIKPGTDYSAEAERIGQDQIRDLWEETGYSVDGAHENDPRGLYGYNCRHRYYVWFEGLFAIPEEMEMPKPVTIGGKTYDYYAMTQKMRSMERAVRALKREKEALDKLGLDTKETEAKIRQKTAAYKDFCEACKIKPKTERLRYECGTSDLRKTKAWKEFTGMTATSGSGALNNTNDPLGRKREKHAKLYYAEIQNRKKSVVVNKIAKNAGITKKSAQNIYAHVFVDKHSFRDGEIRGFDPDYDMAESFRRILEGKNIKPHDLILLKHENLESNLMKKYNMVYEDAHELTNRKYNYRRALDAFLEGIGD